MLPSREEILDRFCWDGKGVIFTAAGPSIGALVKAYAGCGAKVVLGARNVSAEVCS